MKTKIFITLLVGAFIGLLVAFSTYEVVQKTSGAKFCSSCHEMAPMRAAYETDVHAGAGKSGIRANCVDCHLPHDNLANYLFTKAKNGLLEAKVHFLEDTTKLPWQDMRKQRQHFVYDDGCKKCHTNYLDNEKFSKKAIQMHKHYKSLKGSKKELGCASCHAEVGHNGLNNMLNIFYPKYPLYEKGSRTQKEKIEKKLYGNKN